MADDDGAAPRARPLTQLAALQRAFETLLADADLEVTVPSCSGWSVRELAEHLGSVHVWATGKVLGEKLRVPGPDPAAWNHGLVDARSAAARYGASAELLRMTLASVPADQACQTLSGEGPASFWRRRQTHETLIHLWDLCQALGSPMPPVDPAVWADCVAEVVEVMHPRQIRLGRAAAMEHSLLLVAEDSDRRWRIPSGARAGAGAEASAESRAEAPDGPAAEPAAPSATITAAPAELALLLWGRRSQEGLTLNGDHGAATAVLSGALTP